MTIRVHYERWLRDAIELIREFRLADEHAARTGDEVRWDTAFHELCQFERHANAALSNTQPSPAYSMEKNK